MKLSNKFRKHLELLRGLKCTIAGMLLERCDQDNVPEVMQGEWDLTKKRIRHTTESGHKHRLMLPGTFLSLCDTSGFLAQKLYTTQDRDYFCIAICNPSERSYTCVRDYESMLEAYSNTPLCRMTKKGTPEVYAKFYSQCVPDCKLLVIRDEYGAVTGRAIIYENVTVHMGDPKEYHISFMDLPDYASDMDREYMYRVAKALGVNMISFTKFRFYVLNPIEDPVVTAKIISVFVAPTLPRGRLGIELKIPPGFKGGIPYQSVFAHLGSDQFEGKFALFSDYTLPFGYCGIGMITSDDRIQIRKSVCPRCGSVYDVNRDSCEECGYSLPLEETTFGTVLNSRLVEYEDLGLIPEVLLDEDGKLPTFLRACMEARIFM